MKRFYLIVTATIILACGCNRTVIPRSKLVQIVAELYVTDELASMRPDLLGQTDSLNLYEPVLQKYGYNTDQFKQTIEYYISRPSKLLQIYEEANNQLKEQLTELKKQLDLESYKIMVDTVLTGLSDLKERIEKVERLDSRERVFRWLIFHHIQPTWHTYQADSVSSIFETPKERIWWENNLKFTSRHFYEYKNNSSTLSGISTKPADLQRISEDQ